MQKFAGLFCSRCETFPCPLASGEQVTHTSHMDQQTKPNKNSSITLTFNTYRGAELSTPEELDPTPAVEFTRMFF